MSDPIWYFAQGEAEQGPVTLQQLQAMLASGKLGPADLVWKEGMADWTAARDVPELAEQARAAERTGSRPAGRPAEQHSGRGRLMSALQSPFAATAPLARLLLLLGVLLVVLTRGCDALGERYVARLQAMASSAEEQFEREWEDERAELESERDALTDSPPLSSNQRERLSVIDQELNELERRKREERTQRERGRWREQRAAARAAVSSNIMWAYWRGLFFVGGTLLLTIGLVQLGLSGQPPERWMCLVILATLIYSIYVGGTAW